jgi:hypothetical protein
MDKSEQIVREYLIHKGFNDPIYEPDGNIPPDFLVDGRIAVEVRRLNQNENLAGKWHGLEEIAISLRRHFQETIISMGPPVAGTSWFVTYSYKRPLPEWKILKEKLEAVLVDFIHGRIDDLQRHEIINGFSIEIGRASKTYPTLFVLGGFCDHDSGGFVVSEMLRNIRICIEDKNRKISKVRHKYPEWWLALVDHTGLGADEYDYNELRELIQIDNKWDRIMVVNPSNPTQCFDL